MTDSSLHDRWPALEADIRALVQGWIQKLGGPPRDRLSQELLRLYLTLDRRDAQVTKLRRAADYVAPLRDTLDRLLVERDELRERLAAAYEQWRAASRG